MSKPEYNTDMKFLKTATCKTLSGKSTLTYQLGSEDDEIHVRITKNTGSGFFSDEWRIPRTVPTHAGKTRLPDRGASSIISST